MAKFLMKFTLQLLNPFDWLGVYTPLLERWKLSGMEICDVKIKNGFKDPVKYRIQVIADFPDIGRLGGYGEGEIEILAYEKAICELFERELMKRSALYGGKTTSNGVAAHRFLYLAKHAARDELIERDAFLRHWLTKTSFTRVETPTFLKRYSKPIHESGHELIHATTHLGAKKTAIAIIINRKSGGFLIGSALKANLSEGLHKATREAFYSLIADFETSSDTVDWNTPSFTNHRQYWYHHNEIPSWLLNSNPSQSLKPFKINPLYSYQILGQTPIPVVACSSISLLELWTGATPKEVLCNIEENYDIAPNLDPHPFP